MTQARDHQNGWPGAAAALSMASANSIMLDKNTIGWRSLDSCGEADVQTREGFDGLKAVKFVAWEKGRSLIRARLGDVARGAFQHDEPGESNCDRTHTFLPSNTYYTH